MKRIAVLCLGLTLAGPAPAIDMPPPPPIKRIDWLPASTLRIGKGINAAYRVTTFTGQISELWLHTNCLTRDKTLLFINAQPGKGLRVYSTDSIDRYAPGTPFEPDADSLFMTTAELDLCQQNIPESRWAGLTPRGQPGDKQFIDLNHSSREGKMIKVRLATDFDKIYVDEKYGAPYSVKIQDMKFDCEKAQSILLRTFLLNNQGVVTDMESAKDATFTALSPAMKGAAKTLCSTRDVTQYEGTGTLTLRDKAVDDTAPVRPDLDHNTPAALQRFKLPAEVSEVITITFSNPQQKPTFHSLRYSQNSPDNAGPELMADVRALPDGTTLSMMKMTIGDAVFYSQYQRLFNIVNVKKWETMSLAPWVNKTLENGIILPLTPGETYRSHSQNENRDKPGKDESYSQTCVAGKEWRNAADINPNFPGRYLEFICKNDFGDGREVSSDYAYFEALRVFIRIGFQSAGQANRFTFTDVVVTR